MASLADSKINRSVLALMRVSVMSACTLAAGIAVWFGNVQSVYDLARGRGISVNPRFVDLGEMPRNQVVRVPIMVSNTSRSPIVVEGVYSGCGCLTVNGLPLRLPTWRTAKIEISVSLPLSTEPFTKAVRFVTDSPTEPDFPVVIVSRVKMEQSLAPNEPVPVTHTQESQ